MFNWFKRKELTADFVELTVGRVGFKPITNGMLNDITVKSTVINNVLNDNFFFQLFEYAIVDLSKKQIQNLSLKDGDKLRSKLKEILLRHDIIKVEKKTEKSKTNMFDKSDVEWFDRSRNDMLGKIRGGMNG